MTGPDPSFYATGDLGTEIYDAFADRHIVGSSVEGDVEFYRAAARRTGGPILDVGRGTGRIAVALTADGWDVVGLDRSAPMLGLAERRRAGESTEVAARLELVEADLTDFDLGHAFALEIVRHPATGNDVRVQRLNRVNDPVRQVFDEVWRSTEVDGAGQEVRSLRETLSLRWTYRWEMRHLLELTGFEVLAEFGDVFGSPPAYGREQVWVVRRRGWPLGQTPVGKGRRPIETAGTPTGAAGPMRPTCTDRIPCPAW